MSRIKEMTCEVVREGEDRRATFTAQGAPLRIYTWWHRHTKRQVAKENFCHYCRVVAIWAPLMFIRMMLAKLFSDRQFWICMSLASAAIIIGTGFAFPSAVGVVLVGIILFAGAIAGLFIGFALAYYLQDKSEFDDVPKWVMITSAALIIPTLPTVVAGFIIASIVIALMSKLAKRFYRWMGDTRLVKGRVSPFGVLLLIVVGCVIALSVIGDWWIVPLIVFALIAVIFAGRWATEKLGYYVAQRREDRRISAEHAARQWSLSVLEPVLRAIFNHIHPAKARDEETYWDWYRQYVVRVEKDNHSTLVWSDIYRYASPYYFPDWRKWDESMLDSVTAELDRLRAQVMESKLYAERRREVLVKKVTSPFTAMGDFIILLAQFIRVSKWKICPVVELPRDL